MFSVLIDQIEYINNFSIKSCCVGQVYVINEIIQFSEQKLIDKNMCEWSFNTIAVANFMLRHCDAVNYTLLVHHFRLQNYTFKSQFYLYVYTKL